MSLKFSKPELRKLYAALISADESETSFIEAFRNIFTGKFNTEDLPMIRKRRSTLKSWQRLRVKINKELTSEDKRYYDERIP